MRRRSGRRTERRTRSFSKRAVRKARRSTSRGEDTRKSGALRARRNKRVVPDVSERRRRPGRKRETRNEVSRRDSDRRPAVRTQRTTARRLSPGGLFLGRRNENASSRKTTRSVCTRKKAARRAVIIASGYGGRNGARNYKRHESCGST